VQQTLRCVSCAGCASAVDVVASNTPDPPANKTVKVVIPNKALFIFISLASLKVA
jgi:hypothetical protein